MVRNSKRKAFTIVELVIVIAVIAILAAVMIPTFGGVIDSANLSADKQLLSTVNTQLSIYTGLGNKIETEADLWKALKGGFNGGSDLTAKFDPKSANKGYHYWYNIAKEQVELLKYDKTDGLMNVNTGKMMLRADSVARATTGNGFASSPRCFGDANYNYYFLDTGSNAFAEFFKYIENLSTTDTSDYEDKHNAATTLGGDNAALAAQLKDKMAKTAILTDKPAIVGTKTITYVYIPENTAGKTDYYLNYEGTKNIATNVTATIEIPTDVKGGEGCLVSFGAITVKVNVETVAEVPNVLKAGSVSAEATIIINGGDKYGIEGAEVKVKVEAEDGTLSNGAVVPNVKLDYSNPVTEGFSINVPEKDKDGNITNVIYDQYIALNKIQDNTIKVSVKNSTLAGKGGDVFCQDVKWSIEGDNGGAAIDENTGVVTFPTTFELAELTIKATPVAVNEGQENIPVATKTLKVLKLSNDVTFDFTTNNNSYKDLTVSLGANANRNQTVVVQYSDASVFANFSNIKFYYVNADGSALNQELTVADLERLGMPEAKVSVVDNTSFKMNGFDIDFTEENIAKFKDAVTQTVQITVGQDVYDIDVKMEPSIFAIGYTAYNNFVYTVGDDNAIALGKLFALSTFFGDVTFGANDKIYVQPFNSTPMADGTENKVPIKNGNNVVIFECGQDWASTGVTLPEGTNYLEIRVNDSTATFGVKINLVDGKNVTTAAEFVGSGNVNLVLHSNIGSAENDRFTPGPKSLLSLDGKSIYGNYFKVVADNLYDTDFEGGNAFISMKGGSLNQFILEGPVYARGLMRAMDDKDKHSGFFYFGVAISGSEVKFDDSYLSGFNSPVFVSCAKFDATNTVFEGGAWSNIYIRSGVSEINFNGVETIQNRVTGYVTDQTRDEWSNAHSAGMGIFIHNSQASGLKLNLNDTKQYNWFCADDMKSDYAYASLDAINVENMIMDSKDGTKTYYGWEKEGTFIKISSIIKNIGNASLTSLRFKDANYLKETLNEVFNGHTTFYHDIEGTNYVNAGIVCIDYAKKPTLTIDTTGSDIAYHDGSGEVGITLGDTVLGLGMKAWTYEHGTGCCSAEDVIYRNGEAFDTFEECIADFLNSRKAN